MTAPPITPAVASAAAPPRSSARRPGEPFTASSPPAVASGSAVSSDIRSWSGTVGGAGSSSGGESSGILRARAVRRSMASATLAGSQPEPCAGPAPSSLARRPAAVGRRSGSRRRQSPIRSRSQGSAIPARSARASFTRRRTAAMPSSANGSTPLAA
ncbi:hypothetical protein LUX73_19800 [Actinomadura madurae]|nr:hypothetical protein [Actinomadura madurae]MCQ0006681.1 hypothetical protein [Actinomadura madurae]